MSKVAHTPQLRFPEFSGDWEEKKLSDISDVRDGTHESPKYVLDGFPLITSKNLLSNGSIDFENINLVSEEDYTNINKRSKVDINDILFGMIGTIGNPVIVKETGFAIKNVALIKQQKELLNKFMIFYLSGNSIAKQFYIENTGGTQKFLALGVIRSLKIKFPPDTEQQKIAAFLTAVDNKIEQLSKKQELLGEYKKGLMQQIFSQEIRFKADDGSDFPDWEEKKLGNISNVSKLAGYEFTKYIKYQDTGSIIALRGLNIKKNKLDLSVVKFIDNSDFSRLNRSKLFIDDLMFTYIGTIGEVALIDEDDKYYLAPNVSRIRFNNEVCLPRFAIQYFNREVFKQGEIKKYVSSSSQPALTMGNVRLFILNLPTKPEQQKIANFLSSIDSKIEQVGEQLDKSKQFKKALLQKMFV